MKSVAALHVCVIRRKQIRFRKQIQTLEGTPLGYGVKATSQTLYERTGLSFSD